MKLQMHSIRFNADKKLLTYIEKKLNKLDKFYDKVIDGEVILKINNSSVENKTVEIKLNIPGSQLFCKEHAKTFEAATDIASENLKRQIKRHKDKKITH